MPVPKRDAPANTINASFFILAPTAEPNANAQMYTLQSLMATLPKDVR